MTAMDIKEFVLVETPCCLFKNALKSLENEKSAVVVNAPPGRKKGAFLDEHLTEIRIRFDKGLF